MKTTRTLAAMLMAGCLALQAMTARAEALQGLARWKLGDKPCIPEEVEKLVKGTAVDQRGEIEDALIAVAGSADATFEARQFSCRMLQRIGTDKCVPVLGRLLADKDMSHCARLGLQRMVESAAAGEALRDALRRAADPLKVGILASIGERRDSRAVSLISGFISHGNADVASAALNALGKVGGREGLRALKGARVAGAAKPARLNSLLACAEGLEARQAAEIYSAIYREEASETHRAAALTGLARTDEREAASIIVDVIKAKDSYLRRAALGCVAGVGGAVLTRAVAASLADLPAATQAELIGVLGVRGDAAAVDAVIGYLDSNDADVRGAAMAAVGALGDGRHVTMLLRQVRPGKDGEKALASIAGMTADDVDDALIEALRDGGLAVSAAKALGQRECAKAVPALLKLAETGRADVRGEAWGALGSTASEGDIDSMMAAMLDVRDDGLRSKAGNSVKNACSRASDKQACFDAASRHYERADEGTKEFVIGLAAVTGGSKAMELVSSALKSGNRRLYDKAVRSLSSWPDWRATTELKELAKSATDEKTRIVALRGYISVAEREGNERKRIALYSGVRSLVKRAEEKKLLISKLGRFRDAAAIPILSEYLDDPEVKAEAAAAAVDLGWNIRRGHTKERKALVEKALTAATNKRVVKRGKDLMKRLR